MIRSRHTLAWLAASIAVISALGCSAGDTQPAPVIVPPTPVVAPVVAPEVAVEAGETDAVADAALEAPKVAAKPAPKPEAKAEEKPATTTKTPTVETARPTTSTSGGSRTLSPSGGTKTAGTDDDGGGTATPKPGPRAAITKCCVALRASGKTGTIAHRAEYTAAAEACDGMKDMKDADKAFARIRGVLGSNQVPAACR